MNDDNRGLHDPGSCPGPTSTSGPGCLQFPAPCPQDTGRLPWSTDGSGQGECSADWTGGAIADRVLVPKTLKPGHYVLGWRWCAICPGLSLLLPPSCSVGWVLPAVAAERAPRSLTGISVCIVMIGTAKRLRKVGLSAIQSSQLRASLYVFWRPELTAIHALRNDHPSAGTHSNSSMTINLVCAVWANCADIIIQP
jgi:hypothetical protein